MRPGLLTLLSLLALSCGLHAPAPRIPAMAAPEDDPGEAAAFDRLKRVIGNEEIPVERYFTAIEQMKRMPVYSSARRQFTSGSGAAVAARLPYVARLDTTVASANTADPVHSCTQPRDAKTVWFRVTPQSNGALTALAGGVSANAGTVLTAYPFDGRF
jgi:hypothetical protein